MCIQSEQKFIKSQEDRRDLQRKISLVQLKLHELHIELDRVPRGDDKYLALITQEHSVIKEEKLLKEDLQLLEKEERENFAILSHTVRDSHEKERAQAEKTKYWSIIGSVMGTIVGVLGSTINNHLKMKELRELVENATKHNHILMNPEELSTHISSAVQQHLQAPQTSQDVLEGKWKELKSSLLQTIQHESEGQKKSLIELSQQFKASNNTVVSMDNVNTMDVENFFCTAEQNMKTLLDQQAQHSNKLFAISVILIPTCTWVLCKLLNL
jgi:hypothetical protein